MLKLDEEAPPASVEVLLGQALVMEAHRWSPRPGVMSIPEWAFPDLAELRTHGASLIRGAPSIRVILITISS